MVLFTKDSLSVQMAGLRLSDNQRCGNKWQDSNRYPQNTIRSPKPRKKLDLHGQSEQRTPNMPWLQKLQKQARLLRSARCASWGVRVEAGASKATSLRIT